MGAKAPTKLRLRRPTYKCDSCPKKFLSTQALKTHQICAHKLKSVSGRTPLPCKLTALLGKAVKTQEVTTEKTPDEPKTKPVKRTSSLRKKSSPLNKSPALEKSAPLKESSPLGDLDEAPPVSDDMKKIGFQCPHCFIIFKVYHFAYQHVQRHHCNNLMGQKETPNSQNLIEPVRVELCVKCDMLLRTGDPHSCTAISNLEALNSMVVCTGCKQQFIGVSLFENHISGLHSDDISSFFFPTTNDFFLWKADVEKQTKIQYLVLGKGNTKQMYRCSFFLGKEKKGSPVQHSSSSVHNLVQHCPSSLVVREYSKGIQVHFYKQHHGHRNIEYKVPEKFEQYTMKTPHKPEDPITESEDLYLQFKSIMATIAKDSAKVNIATLKVLVQKALEMETVLNSYDEDESENVPRCTAAKSMSDEQISKALEAFTSKRRTRASKPLAALPKGGNNIGKPSLASPKRSFDVIDMGTPRIVNWFSLADDTDLAKQIAGELGSTEGEPAKEVKPEPTEAKQTKLTPKRVKQGKANGTLRVESSSLDTPESKMPKLGVKSSSLDTPESKMPKVGVKSSSLDAPESKIPKVGVKSSSLDTPESKMPKVGLESSSLDTPESKMPKVGLESSSLDTPESKMPKVKAPSSPPPLSSFNDSYKYFVDKNFTVPAKAKSAIVIDIPKTSRKSNSPPKTIPLADVMQKYIKFRREIKTSNLNNDTPNAKSPKKRNATNKKTKRVVKTKIGQFKPSSPKKVRPVKRKSVGSTPKVGLDYEVKERENDCNILILKL